MEEKTIKAYAINGENGCVVYTDDETCIVDFEIFNSLDHSVKRYKYTVTDVLNRTNAIAFIQFLCCGDANFINAFDVEINRQLYQIMRDINERKLYQRTKDINEKVY